MSSTKDTIGGWINGLSQKNKDRAWQMIDTFKSYWDQTGTIAAHYQFDFSLDVVGAAKIVERLLKSVPPETVKKEFDSLLDLPRGYSQHLPPLVADSEPIESMLQTKTGRYQPFFRGLDHAKDIRDAYDKLNNKKRAACVPECNDFPQNIQDLHMRAKELFDAILDFDDAEEKPRLVVRKTKKRKASVMEDRGDGENDDIDNEHREFTDNTAWKRIRNASDVEINLLAWNLLGRMRDAQSGQVGIGPWATNWKYSRFTTFDERFQAVKKVCRLSKTVVASMMSADDIFTKRLVADPDKEIKQKRSNKSTNLKRDEQNKVALHCQSKGWVVKDEVGRLIDSDGLVITPALPEQGASETVNGGLSSAKMEPAEANDVQMAQYQNIGQAMGHDNSIGQSGSSHEVTPQGLQHDGLLVPQPAIDGYVHLQYHAVTPGGDISNLAFNGEGIAQSHTQVGVFQFHGGQPEAPHPDSLQLRH